MWRSFAAIVFGWFAICCIVVVVVVCDVWRCCARLSTATGAESKVQMCKTKVKMLLFPFQKEIQKKEVNPSFAMGVCGWVCGCSSCRYHGPAFATSRRLLGKEKEGKIAMWYTKSPLCKKEQKRECLRNSVFRPHTNPCSIPDTSPHQKGQMSELHVSLGAPQPAPGGPKSGNQGAAAQRKQKKSTRWPWRNYFFLTSVKKWTIKHVSAVHLDSSCIRLLLLALVLRGLLVRDGDGHEDRRGQNSLTPEFQRHSQRHFRGLPAELNALCRIVKQSAFGRVVQRRKRPVEFHPFGAAETIVSRHDCIRIFGRIRWSCCIWHCFFFSSFVFLLLHMSKKSRSLQENFVRSILYKIIIPWNR